RLAQAVLRLLAGRLGVGSGLLGGGAARHATAGGASAEARLPEEEGAGGGGGDGRHGARWCGR
ncbi:hypothetical protein KEM55_007133, partial [Ascosphaera atra]